MFKVGDWVRYAKTNGSVYKVIETNLEYGKIKILRNRSTYLEEEKYLKLWEPKEGEWVIPSKAEADDWATFTVTKYSNTLGKCEPFVGELPSFIKDIK